MHKRIDIPLENLKATDSTPPRDDEALEWLDDWALDGGVTLTRAQLNKLREVVYCLANKIAKERDHNAIVLFSAVCRFDLGGVTILKAIGLDDRTEVEIAREFCVTKQAVHSRLTKIRNALHLPTPKPDGESIERKKGRKLRDLKAPVGTFSN